MSATQKWAIPNNNLLVRMPVTMTLLPKEGAWVDWTGTNGKYWQKRERQGDITIQDTPPTTKVTEASAVTKVSKDRRDKT